MTQKLSRLLEKLSSSHPHLRDEAFHELISLNNPQVIPIMRRWLKSPSVGTQVVAMEILGTLKVEDSIDDLIEAFHGQTWKYVSENGTPAKYSKIIDSAAKALGQIGTSKAVTFLLNGTKSNDEFRVAGAVVGLSHTKDERVTPILESCMNSESHLVRCYVAEALGEIDDLQAIPLLRKMLQDSSEYVQSLASKSLERHTESKK